MIHSVLGEGVAALCCATALSDRGLDVEVIVPEGSSEAASRFAGGMLAPFCEGESAPDLIVAQGQAAVTGGRLMFRASQSVARLSLPRRVTAPNWIVLRAPRSSTTGSSPAIWSRIWRGGLHADCSSRPKRIWTRVKRLPACATACWRKA